MNRLMLKFAEKKKYEFKINSNRNNRQFSIRRLNKLSFNCLIRAKQDVIETSDRIFNSKKIRYKNITIIKIKR